MTKEQAIQTLIAIISQANFSGTITQVQQIGQQADAALQALSKEDEPVVDE